MSFSCSSAAVVLAAAVAHNNCGSGLKSDDFDLFKAARSFKVNPRYECSWQL